MDVSNAPEGPSAAGVRSGINFFCKSPYPRGVDKSYNRHEHPFEEVTCRLFWNPLRVCHMHMFCCCSFICFSGICLTLKANFAAFKHQARLLVYLSWCYEPLPPGRNGSGEDFHQQLNRNCFSGAVVMITKDQ